jgi:serine/threonine protein phosphatase PrpC
MLKMVPFILQFQLSNAGGRLIIASDGIWDALSNEAAAKACRGLPAELAAKLVVKVILHTAASTLKLCGARFLISISIVVCSASSEDKRVER